MKKTVFCLLVLFVIGLFSGCNEALEPSQILQAGQSEELSRGDAKNPQWVPINLTVEIHLKSVPIHTQWTRYICFYNPSTNSVKRVPVKFWKVSSLHYRGSAYYADSSVKVLKSLSNFNERKYWDKMKLENLNGSTALDIKTCEVRIWYSADANIKDPIKYRTPNFSFDPIIAYELYFKLGAGKSAYTLSNTYGRYRHITNYHNNYTSKGWKVLSYSPYRSPLYYMAGDLGKSGTDLGAQATVDVKYGTIPAGQWGCDETISWYFHYVRNSFSWYNNEFMNPGGPKKMASRFLNAGRLYAWDDSQKAFRKLNSSWNWSRDNETYVPRSGDYFVRLDKSPVGTNGSFSGQHAMMVLSYMQDTSGNKRVSVVEMWDPVKIRKGDPIKVSGRYCVGKM